MLRKYGLAEKVTDYVSGSVSSLREGVGRGIERAGDFIKWATTSHIDNPETYLSNLVGANVGRNESVVEDPSPLKERGLLNKLFSGVGLPLVFGAAVTGFPSFLQIFESPKHDWEHRIEFFREHSEDYNVLSVGDSRAYYGFNPSVLQELAEKDGVDFRPFVIAVPGFEAHDVDYILRDLEESLEDKLVIVEGLRFSGEAKDLGLSDRFSRTHSLPITIEYVRTGLEEYLNLSPIFHKVGEFSPLDASSWIKTKEDLSHLLSSSDMGSFVRNSLRHMAMYLRIGGGFNFLKSKPITLDYSGELGVKKGYFGRTDTVIDEEFPMDFDGKAYNWENWLKEVERVQTTVVKSPSEEGSFRRSLNYLMRANPSGIIYLEYPKALLHADIWSDRVERGILRTSDQEGNQPILLDFNSLRDYPSLFEKKYRFDSGHLNDEGTSIFMGLIWDELVPIVYNDAEGNVRLRSSKNNP